VFLVAGDQINRVEADHPPDEEASKIKNGTKSSTTA
jgi:hypothetical protein